MLRHAHLCFLSAIFDDNGMKIFFIWDSGVILKSKGYPLDSMIKKFDPQKLKETLYLRWGKLVFTSYVEALMITDWKNFSIGPMKLHGKSMGKKLFQWKQFWSPETQINLIFTLRHAHLYFLNRILCDKRVKKFFIWDSRGTPQIQGLLIGKSIKKFWSSETQINLIFGLRLASLCILSAILDDNRVKIFFHLGLWRYSWNPMGTHWVNDKSMKKSCVLENSNKPYIYVETCSSSLPK